MQNRIVSWLLKQPEASLSPALDMCILLPMRIAYLTLRYLLRLILRNEERIRRLRILHKVYVWLNGFFSPSIYTAKITDRIIRKIAGPSRQPFMTKVSVPKYRYRYYCKIIDFAPGREGDVIEHFNPTMGNIVIDVGAHVGRYTILGSKLVGRSEKFVSVPALKLDSIVQYAGIQPHEINWIKIDVEGAEYEVLQGAQNILSNSKDIAVLIEVHNLQNNENLYNPIIDMLKKYEFSIIFEKVYHNGERHI